MPPSATFKPLQGLELHPCPEQLTSVLDSEEIFPYMQFKPLAQQDPHAKSICYI